VVYNEAFARPPPRRGIGPTQGISRRICQPFSCLSLPRSLSLLHPSFARNCVLLILRDRRQSHSSEMHWIYPWRSRGSHIWSGQSSITVRRSLEKVGTKVLNSLGDIIHVSAMNKHIVVLHKMDDIIELMEKSSAIYSSRPWIPAAEM
jgi:hypothetical protein